MARLLLSSSTRGWIICQLFMIIAPIEADAFDRQRHGMVVGVGIGLSPFSSLSTSYMGYEFIGSGSGRSMNLLLGYGISKRDVLAAEFNATTYETDYTGESTEISQMIVALNWYRYYGEVGKSYFVKAGMGAYCAKERRAIRISICFNCPDLPEAGVPEDWGIGLIGGVGRELSKSFQFLASGAVGFPSGYVHVPSYGYTTRRITAVHFSLLVMWMRF